MGYGRLVMQKINTLKATAVYSDVVKTSELRTSIRTLLDGKFKIYDTSREYKSQACRLYTWIARRDTRWKLKALRVGIIRCLLHVVLLLFHHR